MEEITQLKRRLQEQVLERAEADPEWRWRYIEEPEAATSEFPEAQRLRRTYESMLPSVQPPESTTPMGAGHEHARLLRSLTEKILDRAATDPSWKQQLLDEPQAALRTANFPEYQRLEEMRRSGLGSQEGAEEVWGQGGFGDVSGIVYDLGGSSLDPGPFPTACTPQCWNRTCIYTWGNSYIF